MVDVVFLLNFIDPLLKVDEFDVSEFFGGDAGDEVAEGFELLLFLEAEGLVEVVVQRVDISSNLPPSSSWMAAAPFGAGAGFE